MSSQEKPRLSRLTSILIQLQSKRLITAAQIAETYGISIRTVYRDIRTLEQSGVPIITEEGRGYSLMAGYNLPPVMFSEAEANALITAEHFVSKNKDQSFVNEYKKAIIKIRSVLQLPQKEKVDLLQDRIQVRSYNDEQTSEHLIKLQSAITDYNLINISYRTEQHSESKRVVEPFALYTTQDNWLLIAYCRLRSDFRAFRLDRMISMQVLSDTFEPHQMTLQEYFEECKRKYLNENQPLT